MKKWTLAALALSVSVVSCAQKDKSKTPGNAATGNTLLWKISGNGLEKPSYLFGTIHLLCADDANLSENMKKAISEADDVYLEVDMSNIMEMFTAIGKLKMRGDTTFRDLLSQEDYETVKTYFQGSGSMLPFSMLETFKPILAVSVVESGSLPCDNSTMMEQVIMEEAAGHDKPVKGLETLAYQAGILDSIPYKQQARELLAYIKKSENESDQSEMNALWEAYNEQDLKKLEELMMDSDIGINSYTDILLYKRNENWVEKLKELMPGKSLVIAVGAGHLPGERGVINLLKKAGYTVTPVENRVGKSKVI